MSRDSISEKNLSKLEEYWPQDRNIQEDGDQLVHLQVLDDEVECKTPTSSDHKIPTSESCPPTPRKKVQVNLQKRKFPELQFFETRNRDEIESFFRSNFQLKHLFHSSQVV